MNLQVKMTKTLQVVWKYLKSLRGLENRYVFMVQTDFVMGLCTATLLGIAIMNPIYWPVFICSLVVSLALGSYTVKLGIRVWKSVVGKKK